MSKFCSNCGAQVREGKRFCASCGVAIDPLQTDAPPAQPPQNQQANDVGGAAKRERRIPLTLSITSGAAAVVIVAVIMILGGAGAALEKAAKADYYEIGNDNVPSIKLALGEERKVTGVSTSTKDGATIQEITYSVPGEKQSEDMSEYSLYLADEDGWQTLTGIDFGAPKSSGVVGRNSVDKGYELQMQISYDATGYTITIVRRPGEITPTPEPAPAIVAESIFGIIDSGTYHMEVAVMGGSSDGSTLELDKKQDLVAIVISSEGTSARRIAKDGKLYTVVEELQNVHVQEMNPDEITPLEYDSSQLTYLGDGTGDFDGKSSPYSEFKSAKDERLFYFVDDTVLKGIRFISATGTTVDMGVRVLDKNVRDSAFTWPLSYNVDDPTAEEEPWIGLWRYEDDTGVELIHLQTDGIFMVDSRLNGGIAIMAGDYAISEGSLTFMNWFSNGEPCEDNEFALLVDGDTMIIGEVDYYYRVPKEDEVSVLADPLAPYANPNAQPAPDTPDPDQYDEMGELSEGMIMVQLDEKWGFIDETGMEIVPPRYDGCRNFREGMARIRMVGKMGFIDITGKEVVPPKYENASDFYEGMAAIQRDGKWGFIDKTGKEVVSPKYDGTGDFYEGIAAVQLNGKWGYIGATGKEIVSPKYDVAWNYAGGRARVELGGKTGYIDKVGKEIVPLAVSMPAETADELLITQIDEFFVMTREQIIEKLGSDFQTVYVGPEGVCDGYLYEKLGMAFAFYPDSDMLELIDCYSNFKLHGVGIGSLFSEITEALGDSEIVETWLELPSNTAYMLRYRFGTSEYSFIAFEENAPVDMLWIHHAITSEFSDDDSQRAS